MQKQPDFSQVTIVIPTLNEEKNIEKLLSLLKKTYKGVTVIVVDDGSKDNTQAVAKKAGAIVLDRSKEPIHGLCISVLEGAQQTITPFLIVMDGDMQHPYEKVGEIAALLHHCDLVVGTREQVISDWPVQRRIMSKVAIFLGKCRLFISGVYCDDIVSGFFGIRTAVFKSVIEKKYKKYEHKGYKVLFDTLKYLPKATKVYQLKYDFGLREAGASKINWRHVLYYMRSLVK